MSELELTLAKLDQARSLIAECRAIPDAKRLADVAKAAEVYARQAQLGEELEQYAREVRFRAERRIGEFLVESPKNPGVRGRFAGGSNENRLEVPTLKELGIDKKLSSRAQQLVLLPEEMFQQLVIGNLTLSKALRSVTRKERVANDFYPTMPALTQALLERVPIEGRVWSPCAGEGGVSKVLQDKGLDVECGDIDPRFEGCQFFDAADPQCWRDRDEAQEDHIWAQDWTVDNIPFSKAHDILDLAHRHTRIGIAFLLRLSYLEPCKERCNWLQTWSDQLTHLITFSPRPPFRDEPGADSVTVAWFVWQKAFSWKALGVDCPFQFVYGWRNEK